MPDSDTEMKEVIFNQQDIDSRGNHMQTPDNTYLARNDDKFRIKTKNQNFAFGSFNNYKETSPPKQQDQMLIMHYVSPKFKRDSLNRSEDGGKGIMKSE